MWNKAKMPIVEQGKDALLSQNAVSTLTIKFIGEQLGMKEELLRGI